MIAVAYTDGPVLIWNTATRQIATTITTAADAACLAFSPGGKTLAICQNDVLIWDIARRRVNTTLNIVNSSDAGSPAAAAFSPDGATLRCRSTRTPTRTVTTWHQGSNSGTSRQSASQPISPGAAVAGTSPTTGTAAPLPPQKASVAASPCGRSRANRGARQRSPTPRPNAQSYSSIGIDPVAFSPDGATLATADGSPTNSSYVWNAATGQLTATLTDPGSLGVADLAFTPDGKLLITADGNGSLYFWQLASGTPADRHARQAELTAANSSQPRTQAAKAQLRRRS